MPSSVSCLLLLINPSKPCDDLIKIKSLGFAVRRNRFLVEMKRSLPGQNDRKVNLFLGEVYSNSLPQGKITQLKKMKNCIFIKGKTWKTASVDLRHVQLLIKSSIQIANPQSKSLNWKRWKCIFIIEKTWKTASVQLLIKSSIQITHPQSKSLNWKRWKLHFLS